MDVISELCDPFAIPPSNYSQLINLASGKAASKATEKYLTETLEEGKRRCVQFLSECNDDPARFLGPIKRRKVQNFASENLTGKTMEGKSRKQSDSIRDAFGRILVVASHNTNLDLMHIMEYPITDIPLSIAHPDGTFMKSPKSKLLKRLEGLQTGVQVPDLTDIGATIIDGGFLLHSFLSVAGPIASYSSLARNLLVHIASHHGKEIHVLFDTYQPFSIKGSERRLRGSVGDPFLITGPEQRPKQSGPQLLKNEQFKDQLATFLLEEWTKNHYGAVLGEKILVASHGGRCLKYTYSLNGNNPMLSIDYPAILQGRHEEADTLIAMHAFHLSGSVIVRATDTDVLIILLGMEHASVARHVIMDCGSGNNRRFININQIQEELESQQKGLTAALPGLHAFTGCDFTASFYGKGKCKPLDLLMKQENQHFIQFFTNLKSTERPDQKIAEEFVCNLYGFKNLKKVNEARHAKLLQMTGTIKKEEPLHNTKKIDCALLPPCSRSLENKLKRSHFVAIMWGNASSADPTSELDPIHYGWKRETDFLLPEWFCGPQLPDSLFTNPTESVKENQDIEKDKFAVVDDTDEVSDDCDWSSDEDDNADNDSDDAQY